MKKGDIVRRKSKASNTAFGAYYKIVNIKKNKEIIGYCVDCEENIGIIGKRSDNFIVYSTMSVLVSDTVFFNNTSPLQFALKIKYNERTKCLMKKPDLVKIFTKSGKYIVVRQDGITEYTDYWNNRMIKIYYDQIILQHYGKK